TLGCLWRTKPYVSLSQFFLLFFWLIILVFWWNYFLGDAFQARATPGSLTLFSFGEQNILIPIIFFKILKWF
ncbi:MAG: hypothetical protein ACO27Q_10085, partial [Bacteroidia bacterium]